MLRALGKDALKTIRRSPHKCIGKAHAPTTECRVVSILLPPSSWTPSVGAKLTFFTYRHYIIWLYLPCTKLQVQVRVVNSLLVRPPGRILGSACLQGGEPSLGPLGLLKGLLGKFKETVATLTQLFRGSAVCAPAARIMKTIKFCAVAVIYRS